MMRIDEFRSRLEEATLGIPTKHPERIAALKKVYSHKIAVQGNSNFVDTRTDCFLYVFRDRIAIDIVKVFETLVEDNPDLFERIGERVISEGFISLHEDRNSDDQIVVYFDHKDIKHFGKLVEDRVVSKWGRGLVWKHGLFEVPLSYGTRVMYSNGQINENVLRKVVSEFQPRLKNQASTHQDHLTSG